MPKAVTATANAIRPDVDRKPGFMTADPLRVPWSWRIVRAHRRARVRRRPMSLTVAPARRQSQFVLSW
jgi:hypothetical protein